MSSGPDLARGIASRAFDAPERSKPRRLPARGTGLRPAFLAFARGIDAVQPGAGAAASAEGSTDRPVRAAPMAAMVTSEMPTA